MSESTGSIVCGVDGSPASLVAASVARELATALDRRLVLVHAAQTPEPLPFGGTWMHEAQAARAACDGRALLDHIAPEAAHRVGLADPVQYLEVVARRERAELVVIGTRRPRSGEDEPSRSLADELVAAARCPVVLVSPAVLGPVTRSGVIVCAHDGSGTANDLTAVAKGLGDRLGLAARSVFVAPSRGWYDAPPPSVEVLRGDPVVELTRCARLGDVRMVAVGAGRSGVWCSRSATALAHAVRVPVVLVPAPATAGTQPPAVEVAHA